MVKCVIDYLNIDVLEIVCVLSNNEITLNSIGKIQQKIRNEKRKQRILDKCTVVKYFGEGFIYETFGLPRKKGLISICFSEHVWAKSDERGISMPIIVDIFRRWYKPAYEANNILYHNNSYSFEKNTTKYYKSIMKEGILIRININNGFMTFKNNINKKIIDICILGRQVMQINDKYNIFKHI